MKISPDARFLRSSAGFTLLELLISMTIVSLLATTILFGWRIASSAWQRADTRLRESRTVLEANRLLQEQMASMLPFRTVSSMQTTEIFFQGTPTTARFVSRYSLDGRGSSGLSRIEYQIAEGPEGTKQLLMNEFPVRSRQELGNLILGTEDDPSARILRFPQFERGSQTLTLIEGLRDCRFEYYRASRPYQSGAWVDQWVASGEEIPQSMAIRIAGPAESGGVRPVSILATAQYFSTRTK